MPRFRRRPTVVDAEQWFPGRMVVGVYVDYENGEARYFVVTIHRQRAYLAPGDWILPESDGRHHYPVKPDVFAATYEPAD